MPIKNSLKERNSIKLTLCAAAVTFNGGEKVTEIPRGMSAVSSVQLAASN